MRSNSSSSRSSFLGTDHHVLPNPNTTSPLGGRGFGLGAVDASLGNYNHSDHDQSSSSLLLLAATNNTTTITTARGDGLTGATQPSGAGVNSGSPTHYSGSGSLRGAPLQSHPSLMGSSSKHSVQSSRLVLASYGPPKTVSPAYNSHTPAPEIKQPTCDVFASPERPQRVDGAGLMYGSRQSNSSLAGSPGGSVRLLASLPSGALAGATGGGPPTFLDSSPPPGAFQHPMAGSPKRACSQSLHTLPGGASVSGGGLFDVVPHGGSPHSPDRSITSFQHHQSILGGFASTCSNNNGYNHGSVGVGGSQQFPNSQYGSFRTGGFSAGASLVHPTAVAAAASPSSFLHRLTPEQQQEMMMVVPGAVVKGADTVHKVRTRVLRGAVTLEELSQREEIEHQFRQRLDSLAGGGATAADDPSFSFCPDEIIGTPTTLSDLSKVQQRRNLATRLRRSIRAQQTEVEGGKIFGCDTTAERTTNTAAGGRVVAVSNAKPKGLLGVDEGGDDAMPPLTVNVGDTSMSSRHTASVTGVVDGGQPAAQNQQLVYLHLHRTMEGAIRSKDDAFTIRCLILEEEEARDWLTKRCWEQQRYYVQPLTDFTRSVTLYHRTKRAMDSRDDEDRTRRESLHQLKLETQQRLQQVVIGGGNSTSWTTAAAATRDAAATPTPIVRARAPTLLPSERPLGASLSSSQPSKAVTAADSALRGWSHGGTSVANVKGGKIGEEVELHAQLAAEVEGHRLQNLTPLPGTALPGLQLKIINLIITQNKALGF